MQYRCRLPLSVSASILGCRQRRTCNVILQSPRDELQANRTTRVGLRVQAWHLPAFKFESTLNPRQVLNPKSGSSRPEQQRKRTMSEQQLRFTATQHAEVTPAIDPAKVKLSQGYTVCVIGASRGIGASIAYAYALAGASTLILTARNPSSLDAVASRCKELQSMLTVECEACSPVDSDSVQALAASIKGKVQP